MAAKKSTKVAEEVIDKEVKNTEEPVVNEENKVEEVQAEELPESTQNLPEPEGTPEEELPDGGQDLPKPNGGPAEEVPDDAPSLPEPDGTPAEELPDNTPNLPEPENVPGEELPEENGVDIKEITEQFADPEKRLNSLDLTEENKEKAVKEELQKVEEVEKKLADDIKKAENALPEKHKDFVKKIFRQGFEDYWNGVTETI